jgi:hypothetical protein
MFFCNKFSRSIDLITSECSKCILSFKNKLTHYFSYYYTEICDTYFYIVGVHWTFREYEFQLIRVWAFHI